MYTIIPYKRKHDKSNRKAKRARLDSQPVKKTQIVDNYDDDEEDEPKQAPVNDIYKTDDGQDVRSRSCPYLDTIRRDLLDFDFEKLCSVSLTHLNVYVCLVCGKYFQGRGHSTHAYTHSVSEGHHVYLNLETHKFYCLPDDYEIFNNSLEDIIYLLNPTFSPVDIVSLDQQSKMVRAYNGLTYFQGVVGLNNIKANDYCNVVLQMLSHICPLRDYFLDSGNYKQFAKSANQFDYLLVHRFGELIRKLWNPRNFKTHVSPHEFLQAVVLCSKKRFQITEQGDSVEFLTWLLNALDMVVRRGSSSGASAGVISSTLRGQMRVSRRKMMPTNLTDAEKQTLADNPDYMETVTDTKFFYLTCDLPPAPLYLDEFKESIIPQVSLSALLSKFNGTNESESKTHRDSCMRRFQLRRLPPYLILNMKRFVKNIFTLEKNATIVNFPIKGIDFGDLLNAECRAKHKYTTYDLVVNVVHDGPPTPGSGNHRVHVMHLGTGKWFELQDLHVTEVLPQMIPLSESLIQVWAVDKSIPNPSYVPVKKPSTRPIKKPVTDATGTVEPTKSEQVAMEAVVLCSKKRFQITEQGDSVEFLTWLLNALDMVVRRGSSSGASAGVISSTLRGQMRVSRRKMMPTNLTDAEKQTLADNPDYMETVTDTKFFYLTCDLPPAPLYLDEFKESIIPQVSLSALLSKFNGTNESESKTHRDSCMRRFQLRRLPPYLILNMKRFVKNIFTLEKNATIVNFPIKGIDFGDLLNAECRAKHKYTTYDLVVNVVHDGPPTPGSGNHRVHVMHLGTGKWFELQDLHVTEVLPQMIPLSESLIQVWAVDKSIPNPSYVPVKKPSTRPIKKPVTDATGTVEPTKSEQVAMEVNDE